MFTQSDRQHFNKVSFSERLLKAMQLRKMRQIDLVNATGLPKSAISQYLSGMYVPKMDNIYKMAKALEVSASWLLGFDVEINQMPVTSSANEDIFMREIEIEVSKQDPALARIINLYNLMNKIGQEKLLDYAESLIASRKETYCKFKDPD